MFIYEENTFLFGVDREHVNIAIFGANKFSYKKE